MNEAALVSVVVPVYNASLTIEKCICSIEKQSYNNLQIILVNDGSTDLSLDICISLAAKDKRIQIINQINQGVSVARNAGIEAAIGEYICFVDSDDRLEVCHIAELIRASANADFVISGFLWEHEMNPQLRAPQDNFFILDKTCNRELKSIFINGFIHPCWNKLFRTSLIKNNEIRFPESISISEDSFFCLSYLMHCKTIRVTSNCSYIYHISDSNPSLSKQVYFEIFDIYAKLFRKIFVFITKTFEDIQFAELIANQTIYPQVISSIKKILRSPILHGKEKHLMLNQLEENKVCRQTLKDGIPQNARIVERTIAKLAYFRCYRMLQLIIKRI